MAARCGNPSNSDQVILSGPQRSINRKADSQDDSQLAVQLRKRQDNLGIGKVITELRRTLMDCRGRQTCGLQTVCGALLRRPGWVRFPSIPAKSAMTAKPQMLF